MKSFRHRQQPTLPHNETAAVVLIGFDQVRFEAEALGEFQCRRLFRDEGIGTAFEQKTVALAGLNDPANRDGRPRGELDQPAYPNSRLRSSIRCAAARPVMPPPMITTRFIF